MNNSSTTCGNCRRRSGKACKFREIYSDTPNKIIRHPDGRRCGMHTSFHFPPKLFANPKILRHSDGYPNFSSSRRKSGPRLSTCVPVASLGPGVRRDDGIMNEFNVMIKAQMTTKMCESDSDGRRGPDFPHVYLLKAWVPASRLGEAEASLRRSKVAGMTEGRITGEDVRQKLFHQLRIYMHHDASILRLACRPLPRIRSPNCERRSM